MLFYSVLAVFLVLLSPLIVLSDILILSAWFRYKRLRTPSNIFIATLAFSDLCLSLLIPTSIAIDLALYHHSNSSLLNENAFTSEYVPNLQNYALFAQHSSKNYSQNSHHLSSQEDQEDELKLSNEYEISMSCSFNCLNFLLLLLFSSNSLLSITSISLDRFLSVAQPLRYNHFVTMSHGHKFILISFTYTLLSCLIPFLAISKASGDEINYGGKILLVSLSLVYIPSLVLTLLSYGYIYMIARSHAKQIYSVEISLNNIGILELSENANTNVISRHAQNGAHRYGLTLSLLILGLLSWLPLYFCALWDVLGDGGVLKVRENRLVALAPIVISTLFNPWLYAYRSSEVRNGVIRIADGIMIKISGRPLTYPIFYQNHKNVEMTSCASNVRLLGISPSATTGPCSQNNPEYQNSTNCSGNGSYLTVNGISNVNSATLSPPPAQQNENGSKNKMFLLYDCQVSEV